MPDYSRLVLGRTKRNQLVTFDIRNKHLLAIGTTQTGKSNSFRSWVHQLSGDENIQFIVFDELRQLAGYESRFTEYHPPRDGEMSASPRWLLQHMWELVRVRKDLIDLLYDERIVRRRDVWIPEIMGPRIILLIDEVLLFMSMLNEQEQEDFRNLLVTCIKFGIKAILNAQKLTKEVAGSAIISDNIPSRIVFYPPNRNWAAEAMGNNKAENDENDPSHWPDETWAAGLKVDVNGRIALKPTWFQTPRAPDPDEAEEYIRVLREEQELRVFSWQDLGVAA